jgi:hypothetical protein
MHTGLPASFEAEILGKKPRNEALVKTETLLIIFG